MCQGGQVRSVGLKFALTYRYSNIDCDVIACGHEGNTEETRSMLFRWADLIIIMEGYMKEYVPKEFHIKMVNGEEKRRLYCFDVGMDSFGNPFHPMLQGMLDKMIQKNMHLFSK